MSTIVRSQKLNSTAKVRPGDKVVTLGNLDSFKPIDTIRSICFFIIRHQLDERLLRDALDTTIRQHLPIVGARIEGQVGPKERQRYRLPQPFPDDYELFRWSSKAVSKSFDESNILPSTKDPKSIMVWGRPIPEIEKDLSPDTPDWPVERKFEQPDCPLLLVHLTKFTDATVVTTNLPHAVADMMGYASFIRAWLQVAKGETPPAFLELDPDALMGPKISDEEIGRKGAYRVPGSVSRLSAMMSYGPESMKQPDEDRRLAYLPAPMITKLKDSCQRQIKEKYGGDLRISSADVITGIVAKLGHLHRTKPKNMLLSGSLNARGRHPKLPADKPFLHNAITFNAIDFPIDCNTRLFEIVRYNRLSVEEGLKLENIERCFAVTKALREAGKSMMVLERGWTSLAMTNWCSAWKGTDFSAAVLKKEEVKSKQTEAHVNGHAVQPINGDLNGGAEATTEELAIEPAGTAEGALRMEPEILTAQPIVLGHSLQRHIKFCRWNCQVMSYEQGGFWIDFSCSTKNMPLVEELLKNDPFLESI